jgi:murein DD-endopeptidase MepM/ murein hydrolase activator NlpD
MPALLILLLCAAAALPGASVYAPEPQLEAVRLWGELEHKVRDGAVTAKEARAEFRRLWPLVRLDEVPAPRPGRWQWVFPVPGSGFRDTAKKSYRGAGYSYYDGPQRRAHPAIDIFVRDRDHDGLDDRNKKPIAVVSCMDGVVVSTQPFWKPEDSNPDGVYACILDQEDGRFFIYARLSKLKVSVGQLVQKGQVIGWVGRSGRDVVKTNMRTHLHLQVHDFADGRFYTLNPLHSLRVARQLTWPLPEPDYSGEGKRKGGGK